MLLRNNISWLTQITSNDVTNSCRPTKATCIPPLAQHQSTSYSIYCKQLQTCLTINNHRLLVLWPIVLRVLSVKVSLKSLATHTIEPPPTKRKVFSHGVYN